MTGSAERRPGGTLPLPLVCPNSVSGRAPISLISTIFFKWPFLTLKCQNLKKSYKIHFKDEIIVDHDPEVYTCNLIYIGVRL